MGNNNIPSNGDIVDFTHIPLHGVEGKPQGGEHGRSDCVRVNGNAAGNYDVYGRIPVHSVSIAGIGRYGLDTIRTHME
mgnify:CR=1 FL=1